MLNCVSVCRQQVQALLCAGNAPNAVLKAAAISSSVNGSGHGASGTQLYYLTGLSNSPANWFNVSASFVNADPPGVGLCCMYAM